MSIQSSPDNLEAPAPGAARGVRFPPLFWMLVTLSLITIGVGVWWLVLEGGLGTGGGAVPPPAAVQKTPAIDFQLTDLSGKPVRLSDLRGKVVLLNFWATWCPPCKAEMPDLETLYREYGAEHGFTVLAVDVEENADAAQTFARQFGLTFPLLPDSDGRVSNQRYFIRALPTSFIIDREGRVRYTWTGQQDRRTMLASLTSVW